MKQTLLRLRRQHGVAARGGKGRLFLVRES